MKKICKVILAAAAVVALAAPAMAADKLIVKNAAGTADVAKITDSGQLLFPFTSLPGKNAGIANGGGDLDHFSLLAVNGDPSVTDSGAALQIVPRGGGFCIDGTCYIKSQITVFNTDYNANATDYEAMVVAAQGGQFAINSVSTDTNGMQLRPITFQLQNVTKLTLATNGYVGIGTTTPTSPLAVAALPVFASNAAAKAGPPVLKAGDFYRTSTGVLMVVF